LRNEANIWDRFSLVYDIVMKKDNKVNNVMLPQNDISANDIFKEACINNRNMWNRKEEACHVALA